MDWGTLLFWAGSAALLIFAIVTVVWAPGRRRDPGLDPGRDDDPPPDGDR